jgi:hypothetical protein
MAGGQFVGPIRGKGNDKVVNAENVTDEKIAKLQDAVNTPAASLTQEQVDDLIASLSNPAGTVDPRTNGGRLVVTPAYMNTASDSALQLNTVDKKALFGWTQEITHEMPSLSAYITAVGTAGDLYASLYKADAKGEPTGAALKSWTPLDTANTADTWIRDEVGPNPILYPGRYCLVFSTDEGSDISMSYNRQNTALDSGLVPGCWSKSNIPPVIVALGNHYNWSGYSIRQVIPAGAISTAESVIRIGFQGFNAHILHASIVEQSSGSTGTDTPVSLSFLGYDDVTVSSATGIVYCDPLTFAYDPTKVYLVTMDLDTAGDLSYKGDALLYSMYYKAASSRYDQQTFSEDGMTATQLAGVTSFGADWTDLTKDSQPALLNVITSSTVYHVPQLVYGWTGKSGNKVARYENQAWSLSTIPDEGVFYDMSEVIVDQPRNVYLYSYEDVLGLSTNTVKDNERTFQDGIEVDYDVNADPADPKDRFLGLVSVIERESIGGYNGPIRCESYNTLWNAENQTEQVMFRQPYAAITYYNQALVDSWVKWNNGADDHTLSFLVGSEGYIKLRCKCGMMEAETGYIYTSIAIDVVSPHKNAEICQNSFGYNAMGSIECSTVLPEGLHEAYPIDYPAYSHNRFYWYFFPPVVYLCLTAEYMG